MKFLTLIKRYIALILIFTVIASSVSFAQEPPNREQVSGAISQEAAVQLVNSGDNVEAEKKQDEKHDQQIENENKAAIEQATQVNANTGNNTAERNISIGGNAGTIQTGNVGVVSQAAAAGNTNTTAVSGGTGGSGGGGSSTSAVNSGDNVSANSSDSNTTNTDVNNSNSADVTQSTAVNANTGGNRADRNIAVGGGTAGQISTGSVGVFTDYLVSPNGNATLIGGSDTSGHGPGSGASIRLANAGDNVRANSATSSASNTSVENLNNAFITQLTYVNADTGNNTANRNIAFGGDAGVIQTGDVLVGVSYALDGNDNRTRIEGGGGAGVATRSTTGSTEVVNTGDNVDASSDSSSETSTAVANTNKTYINQTAFINANTGGNSANRNISYGGHAGAIRTGSVGVNVSFLADFSKNTTVVQPATNYYHYLPAPTSVPQPTIQSVQQYPNAPVYYTARRQPAYYQSDSPQVVPRSQYASYVSANPIYTGGAEQARVAVQENAPQAMSVGGLSQLMIMLISLGALGLRKMVRV